VKKIPRVGKIASYVGLTTSRSKERWKEQRKRRN